MGDLRTGYARVSTDKQDLAAQRDALLGMGVAPRSGSWSPGCGVNVVDDDDAATVSVAEAASMLGVHRTTVHRLVKAGDIRSAGYGRVFRADVAAHID